jgi:D-tyrosyl-tRNA(Tyr) deacylase
MRAVIQRVKSASVSISDTVHAAIGTGLLILLGIEEADGPEDSEYLSAKICRMRIFADAEGKMNLDLQQANGDLLVVSQFTLHASIKKGNRPSFIAAARPEKAIPLYEKFIADCTSLMGKPPLTGVFGADMQVELINDGPVPIVADSKNKE